MGFGQAFLETATFAAPLHVEDFRRQVEPAWIEEALKATGMATIRRRKLPVESVVWIVLGMVLYRDRPLEDLVTKLGILLPGGTETISKSAVAQARERMGSAPMEWLFKRCASAWAEESAEAHRWRGLRVYGIDGSSVRVPDTRQNRETFGGQTAANGTTSAYPMVRLAVLMVLRSHLLTAASFGRYEGTSEWEHALPLCNEMPDRSLLIVDKGLFAAAFFLQVARGYDDRHWLTRAKANVKAKVLQTLGPGDEIVEMAVSSEARAKDPTLPKTWSARRIRYQIPGFAPQYLLTSLRDPERFPRDEVIALYHERWELELGYDEIKTDLLKREEAIRSRTPEGVRQEMWGVLLAYNLVRHEMAAIARKAKLPPTRISFVESLRWMRDEWNWLSVTKPGALVKRLAAMRRNILRYVLPPRRKRSYPRVVKVTNSKYKRKRQAIVAAN
jgi:hypothetical protein